jgi:hypothetical protein
VNRPLPEEERLARQRARKRAWWDAHPEYRAEYEERNRERIRERNRERMRARSAEERRQRRAVERAAEWARNNPDKRRAYRERYKERNPERYRAAQRDYYQRNKEAINARRQARDGRDPEKLREKRRAYDAERRTRSPGEKRTPSDERREKYLAQARKTRRLVRSLEQAGLPPRRLHRTLASERRVNEADANAFFGRARSRSELVRLTGGDLGKDLMRGWARYSTLVRRRGAFLGAVQEHLARHGEELHEDVRLDSRAREVRGKPPLDIDTEVRRRAVEAVRNAYAGLAAACAPTATRNPQDSHRASRTPQRGARSHER